MNEKKAFGLVEFSVVLIAMSLMLSAIIVSRIVIANVHINRIHEEYRMFAIGFRMFNEFYGCIPGDCNAKQVLDLLSQLPGYVPVSTSSPPGSACTVPQSDHGAAYMPLGTNKIESTAKRTCAMYELQAAGYLEGLVLPDGATNADHLVNSVAGKYIPYAKLGKEAAWDLRTVTSASGGLGTNTITLPASVSRGSSIFGGALATWAGSIELVLHDARSMSNAGTIFVPEGDIVSNSANPPGAAISPKLAKRLDLKFDDGMPYSGIIAAGRLHTLSASPGVCTNIGKADEMDPASMISIAMYLESGSKERGCLIAFDLKIK